MKAEFYLPYYPEGDIAGNTSDLSDEEYARQLSSMFNGGYNSFMNEAMGMSNDSRYGFSSVIPSEYAIESVADNGKVDYYQFECLLNDENDKGMDFDEFTFYAKSGNMCAFFVHLTVYDEYRNPDAINEINFWLKESREIMNDRNIDDDHKFLMLPYKDIIIKLSGIDNLMVPGKYMLSGSRVIEQDDRNNFAIIVTKIEVVE